MSPSYYKSNSYVARDDIPATLILGQPAHPPPGQTLRRRGSSSSRTTPRTRMVGRAVEPPRPWLTRISRRWFGDGQDDPGGEAVPAESRSLSVTSRSRNT